MHSQNQANLLIGEESPYLLQHAYNPVKWYPWGEDALTKARKEQKLLIISVGYSACHWCHVMERESFEDPEVAELMNKHFVAIKVDREERPDIDEIYMNACHLTKGGNCGWPLNAFALPDGRPFWAGTYFPKAQWMSILTQIAAYHIDEPARLEHAANEIMKGMRQMNVIHAPVEKKRINSDLLTDAYQRMLEQQDFIHGGRQGQPKFPMPVIYQFLMQCYYHFDETMALNAVKTTLDNIMTGGIYDQLGGGFARYAVDKYWFAPHFEKMLYDNAQLISLYSDFFRVTKNVSYLNVVTETLQFAEMEWLAPEGGFYSALDADSEGVEGLFYVWTADEIRNVLNNSMDTSLFFDYFQVDENGNWEHGYNILYRKAGDAGLEEKYGLSPKELQEKINQLKSELLTIRSARIKPQLDHKIITSWNGLMLKAYTDAFKANAKMEYKTNAVNLADFLLKNALDEESMLYRTFGKKRINGFLDDYANLIFGLTGLYEISFEEKWLFTAKKLSDYTLKHFYQEEEGVFYYTSDLDPPLVSRNSEMNDNVIPGASSTMARNLFLLSKYFRDERYLQIAEDQMQKVCGPASKHDPSYYANWLQLGLSFYSEPFEISVVGENALDLAGQMMQYYLPDCIYSGTTGESALPVLADKTPENEKALIYICRGNSCFAPVKDVASAIETISNLRNQD